MKKEALHIYLFIHGQTNFNRDGRFTGWLDSRLTFLGKKQAGMIAKKLKNKKFQIAFYTRLMRSQETLAPVLKFHPECEKLIKDDRMIERNYGLLNGKTHEEFIKKYGEEMYNKVHRGFDTRPPKGESFAMVEKRVGKFIKFLIPYMKKHKVSVAISAHGNSIRLFRKIIEKKSREQAVKWAIPYDDYFEYRI